MTKPESYYTTHKIDGFEDEFEIHLMLFEEVKNAREISESIKSGKFDIELALMNPKTVFSENIICLAAFKAIASMQTNQMVTKTLHSEVIFNCAPKTNINEAFRRFGASADSQAMIVARVVNIKDTKKRNNNNYDNNNNNNNSNEKKCAQSLRMHAVQHLSLLSSSSSAAAADVASAEIDYDFMTGSGGEVFSPPIVLLKNNTRKKRKRASRQQQRIIIVKPDALVQRVYTSAITATAKRGTTSTKKKTRSIGKGSTKSEKETTTTTTTTTTNERNGAASSLSNIFEDETELTLALPDITISVVEHGYPKATDLIVCSSTGRERLVGCYDCGITKTPQWRQGTHGPKTLCNRCGVSWRKLNPTSRNNNK